MCVRWWHICYRPLLAILRKKVGKPKEESRNLYGFIDMNLYIQIHLYDFIYVNSYNIRIHIIWIVSSSLVHKGYFHGHDSLTSIYNPQIEDKSHVTAAGLTNLFMLARTSLLSELVLATIKKSCGTIGTWSNIRLQLEGQINEWLYLEKIEI